MRPLEREREVVIKKKEMRDGKETTREEREREREREISK